MTAFSHTHIHPMIPDRVSPASSKQNKMGKILRIRRNYHGGKIIFIPVYIRILGQRRPIGNIIPVRTIYRFRSGKYGKIPVAGSIDDRLSVINSQTDRPCGCRSLTPPAASGYIVTYRSENKLSEPDVHSGLQAEPGQYLRTDSRMKIVQFTPNPIPSGQLQG